MEIECPTFQSSECFPTTMRQPQNHGIVWVGMDFTDHLVPPLP